MQIFDNIGGKVFLNILYQNYQFYRGFLQKNGDRVPYESSFFSENPQAIKKKPAKGTHSILFFRFSC